MPPCQQLMALTLPQMPHVSYAILTCHSQDLSWCHLCQTCCITWRGVRHPGCNASFKGHCAAGMLLRLTHTATKHCCGVQMLALSSALRSLQRQSCHQYAVGLQLSCKNNLVACRHLTYLLAERFAALGPSKNALVRSTAVPTFVSMGVASNVVPAHTDVTFDMRTLPGKHCRKHIKGH